MRKRIEKLRDTPLTEGGLSLGDALRVVLKAKPAPMPKKPRKKAKPRNATRH